MGTQIKMSFCFIVEYLNVKVIQNFRDADTYMACTTSIPSSVLHYTLIKDVYKRFESDVHNMMFTISLK